MKTRPIAQIGALALAWIVPTIADGRSQEAQQTGSNARERADRSAVADEDPQLTLHPFVTLTALMGPCDSTPTGNLVGVVKVTLPPNLNLDTVSRVVRHKRKQVDPIDPAEEKKPQHDGDGDPNDEPVAITAPRPFPPRPRISPPPFHINLKNANLGASGYVLVQIIKPKPATYSIYRDPGLPPMQGVVAGLTNVRGSLCSPELLDGRPTDRQVATFYIDLSKIPYGSPPQGFNIGVLPRAYPDTPLFFDPKVHNEG